MRQGPRGNNFSMRHNAMPDKDLQPRVLQLIEKECSLLQRIADSPAGLSALVPIVPNVDLSRGGKRRPLRLKIPLDLDATIRRVLGSKASRAEQRYIDVLIAAAHRYREKYPLPKEWRERPQDDYTEAELERRRQEDELKIDRKMSVLRLADDERALLQNLGRGRADSITRHQALCDLVDIVDKMSEEGELDEVRRRRRKSTRVKLPRSLITAIDTRVRNGDRFATVLLAAAQVYADQHPEIFEQ
jgi:hypothetical protein